MDGIRMNDCDWSINTYEKIYTLILLIIYPKKYIYIYEYHFGIIHWCLASNPCLSSLLRLRGARTSGGVTGTIFIISGVGGCGHGGARGPGGSADIRVLGASRGERLLSSRLEWLGRVLLIGPPYWTCRRACFLFSQGYVRKSAELSTN